MPRIRTIKPEFWTDSFMVQLDPIYRLIYIALWTSSDDQGFIKDEVERIAMEIMPKENWEVVDDAIQLFIESGRMEYFVANDGETFFRLSNWEKHQKIDRPTNSKIYREDSRKLSIPFATRRAVAEKYGCTPGEEKTAKCYYCGFEGKIHWFKLRDGRPSAWVTFPGLELDHLEAEHEGGENTDDNIILSCRYCNRHKGTKQWFEILTETNIETIRDNSRLIDMEQGTGNREQGIDKKQDSKPKTEKPKEPTFIEIFNDITGKKIKVFDEKAQRQLRARIREGFTMEDIKRAIRNCAGDKYHKENPKYLTPEFITRSDKLQMYLNVNNANQQGKKKYAGPDK